MTTTGTVREWHDDEGWGVIDSESTPGGCWAHFGSVLMSGYRSLEAGQAVSFEYERGWQDGYAFRARAVWIGGNRPQLAAEQASTAAYRSHLHLEFDGTGDGAKSDRTD